MAISMPLPLENIRGALQVAPQLRPFLLHDVTRTGKELGGGSYGAVEELYNDGLVCAGKKMYDALIDPENQGAQNMVDKYFRECTLLSELRHPHIVQFLGICFLSDSHLPVLVMERLQGSLDELLEETPDIPLSIKLSILHDVAKGLVFLHNHNPVIIHRDLTARNVLLDSATTAKIADLGNARIAQLHPNQLAHTMTKGIPGTLVYMPPEASTQFYGSSLDIFSFGHLTLFATTQVFPADLLPHNYFDPCKHKVKARNEIERREHYIRTLYGMLGEKHSLVVFIKDCLIYDPEKRPTARQILERLGAMMAAEHDPYRHMNRLQLDMTLTEKLTQITVQATEITAMQNRMEDLKTELKQSETKRKEVEEVCCKTKEELLVKHLHLEEIPLLTKKLEELQAEKGGLEDVCQAKDEILSIKNKELKSKERDLTDAQQQLVSLIEECANLKGNLEENTQQIHSLQKDIRKLQAQNNTAHRKIQNLETGEKRSAEMLSMKEVHIAALTTELMGKEKILRAKNKVSVQLPDILTYTLPLRWKKTIIMQSGVVGAQAVVVEGKVYIGGGGAESSEFKLFEYTNETCQWREIETSVRWFGMAVINDQLIIAGGIDSCDIATDQVWVMDMVTNGWKQPYPAMPTAKEWCSAIGYKRWMVVAGGHDKRYVEVLDTHSKRWYVTMPLPSDALRPSLTVMQGTLYIASDKSTVSISIPLLISYAISLSTKLPITSEWRHLPDTLTSYPTLTPFHGHLLAVGSRGTCSSTIALYIPHSEQWVIVAQLPSSRFGCVCTVLPDTAEVMVIGGQDDRFQYVKTIDSCFV